ncbi:MAG: MFS transporter [Actinobacteria bacterium]|uniref:Multidrug efflux pump Tap n=1 Tax=freshwater metagenome TaxID=449393 RepID=A0A6J6QU12_9ZZZZ|nr:MFS transporter [Actinomycetota bacterium]
MRRPLYGWLSAEAISLLGTRISMVALPWFVLTTTGSPVKTGLVALAEMLPMVLLKVLGGPVIDRVGARRVAITCDVGSLVVVGSIPVLYDAGWLSFGGFLALVAVAGALRGPGDGAKQAMVPQLVAAAELPMERVTGLSATVERTASMIGTAAAGVLIAAVGPANALVVDAATFGLSALVLAWATVPLRGTPVDAAHPAEGPSPDEGSYRTRLAEGWRFLHGDRLLLGIAVMVALTNLLDLAYASVLLPVWADDTGRGAAAVGLVFAVFAGASALGSACAAAWAARLPRYTTYLVAFLLCGAPRFVVLALDAPVAAVLAVCVVAGFASGFLNPVLGAVIFERIPAPLVGRVTSLTTAMCFALMPLGGLLGGALVGWLGLSAALVVVGAAYFLITTAPALDPTWREMDQRPDPGRVPEHAS